MGRWRSETKMSAGEKRKPEDATEDETEKRRKESVANILANVRSILKSVSEEEATDEDINGDISRALQNIIKDVKSIQDGIASIKRYGQAFKKLDAGEVDYITVLNSDSDDEPLKVDPTKYVIWKSPAYMTYETHAHTMKGYEEDYEDKQEDHVMFGIICGCPWKDNRGPLAIVGWLSEDTDDPVVTHGCDYPHTRTHFCEMKHSYRIYKKDIFDKVKKLPLREYSYEELEKIPNLKFEHPLEHLSIRGGKLFWYDTEAEIIKGEETDDEDFFKVNGEPMPCCAIVPLAYVGELPERKVEW